VRPNHAVNSETSPGCAWRLGVASSLGSLGDDAARHGRVPLQVRSVTPAVVAVAFFAVDRLQAWG
jgi:hypothetical protein